VREGERAEGVEGVVILAAQQLNIISKNLSIN
jgi:hypothetical protein